MSLQLCIFTTSTLSSFLHETIPPFAMLSSLSSLLSFKSKGYQRLPDEDPDKLLCGSSPQRSDGWDPAFLKGAIDPPLPVSLELLNTTEKLRVRELLDFMRYACLHDYYYSPFIDQNWRTDVSNLKHTDATTLPRHWTRLQQRMMPVANMLISRRRDPKHNSPLAYFGGMFYRPLFIDDPEMLEHIITPADFLDMNSEHVFQRLLLHGTTGPESSTLDAAIRGTNHASHCVQLKDKLFAQRARYLDIFFNLDIDGMSIETDIYVHLMAANRLAIEYYF
jgi:hypothetical protein